MREWRHLRLIAVPCLLGVFIAAAGCSDGKQSATSSSTSSGSSSSGGGGGSGGMGGGSNGATLEAAITDMIPFDATPDTTGDNVYAVGLDKDGNAVINQGKLDGSVPSKTLWTGAPLDTPLNIAVSTDGKTIYVADPGAEDASGAVGQIFSIAAAGGMLATLTNANGYRARGLEVTAENSKDVIYFAGTDPTGEAGIFKLPADDSGAVVTVAKGGILRDPSGVVVSKEGIVYACDTMQDDGAQGSVIAINGGMATAIVTGVRAGYPCGIALKTDESAVLVSAFDPVKHTDTVIIIDVNTHDFAYFSNGIDTFVESAGLHRSKQGGDTFAWADTTNGNGLGTVFKVTFK